MKDKQTKQHTTKTSKSYSERKPFVAPALREQSDLTSLTAERTFSFSSGGS